MGLMGKKKPGHHMHHNCFSPDTYIFLFLLVHVLPSTYLSDSMISPSVAILVSFHLFSIISDTSRHRRRWKIKQDKGEQRNNRVERQKSRESNCRRVGGRMKCRLLSHGQQSWVILTIVFLCVDGAVLYNNVITSQCFLFISELQLTIPTTSASEIQNRAGNLDIDCKSI